jgi:hypothetical protein
LFFKEDAMIMRAEGISWKWLVVFAVALAAASGAWGADAIFSSSPINPASPPPSQAEFKAGDRIYCLLQADKTWAEALGRGTDYMLLYIYVDGQEKTSRMISLKRPELLQQKTFVLDVAPDPAKMTNYKDRDIVFDKKDENRIGPEYFTKILGELSPGPHKIKVAVMSYGKTHSGGKFTIDGADYGAYAALHKQIKGAAGDSQKMPRPGMTNATLETEMKKLLKAAGWQNILRVVIKDKDWWMDRASGGDSPIISRHMDAAVAAKASDGTCSFAIVTFQQDKLISGGWGALEITHTGAKTPIPEKNVND